MSAHPVLRRALAALCAAALALTSLSAQAPLRPIVIAFDEVWRTVNDTFYDPAFGGVDWDAVRRELRPRVEAAASEDAGRAVIRDMLARLGQSHFGLMAPPTDADDTRGPATPEIDVRVVGEMVIVTNVEPGSGAATAGVRAGDRLERIGDLDVASVFRTIDAPDVRARDRLVWRRVDSRLSGEAYSSVRLTLRAPDGGVRVVLVPRAVERGTPVAIGNLPVFTARLDARDVRTASGRRVGVIRFNVWMPAIAEPFAEAIDRARDADGLVIDLRGNPGGLADMMRGIAGHIVTEPALLGRMHMRDVDLEFRANPRRATSDGRRVEPFAGPVAVLIDGLTGSASECFVGGLQSLGRVRVFGVPSMGQALPAATKALSNGDVLLYAVGDFVTSTGARLEGRGVIPDELVPLEPAALAAGRDALAAAVSWIERVPRTSGRGGATAAAPVRPARP